MRKFTEARETDKNCWIGDTQTGTYIDGGDLTYTEALDLISQYEDIDREYDEYEMGFYSIYVGDKF